MGTRMNVAILSDIHDQVPNLKKALDGCLGADTLVCCGDLCSPFIAKELGQGFAGPIHVVFGNNDGDRFRIAAHAAKFPHLQFHGEYAELTLGGKRFSVNHFDNIGRAIASGGRYDVVCFGHNHQFEITPCGPTLIINPGEVYGGLSGQATCVLYDTDSGQTQRVDL